MKIPKKLAGTIQVTARWLLQNGFRVKQVALGIGVSLLVISIAGVTWSRTRVSAAPAAPAQASTEEVRDLVAQVAKHIMVKTEENPTIATVEDPDALRVQNAIFYQDAKKGDRLFIWTDKAVLYSPETDRILSVLPINYPASPATTQTTKPDLSASTVEIRNGSGIAGLGKSFGENIKQMGINMSVTGNAKVPTYGHTIIVKRSDDVQNELLELLASLTKGTVVELPAGESAPKGDVLVIVGADYQP